MHIRSVHMHIEFQLFTDGFDVFQTLLVIGPRATDPDLGLVLD